MPLAINEGGSSNVRLKEVIDWMAGHTYYHFLPLTRE